MRIFIVVAGLALAAGLLAPLLVQASGASDSLAPATKRLLNEYPGVRVQHEGSRIHALYGAPMTAGDSPEAAAGSWLREHRGALGVADLSLDLVRAHSVGEGRFHVFAYEQRMGGLPVEGGLARILVRRGDPDRVVLVNAKLASPPGSGFSQIAVTAEEALASMQQSRSFGGLPEWTEPELVVFYREADVDLEESVRAWKFRGVNPDHDEYEAYTYFVDAASGELVYLRDEVYHVDVDGNSQGNATPGTLPDTGSNPPTPMNLIDQTVSIQGGNSSTTDRNGDFTIPHSGGSPVTVEALLEGPWVRVFTDQGSRLSESTVVTPPGPANLFFNGSPSEFETAQMNAYIHTVSTHNFMKDRQPGFTAIDLGIECNTNLTNTCNAFFSGADLSINFFNAGGGCVNTAYTSVVAHEYGHFIVNRLGLAQGAFGEGFGDCMSALQYDDSLIGRDFFGPGTVVRDPLGDNVQYPCSGGIHFCGQVLVGSWFRIRQNFGTKFGEPLGLENAQQLFTDWAMVTVGGIGDDSAHPTTAIEVLTLDDDDGNLDNGTPNYDEICAAYAAHSIPCPEVLAQLSFTYPNGIPTLLAPDQPTVFRVAVSPNGEDPVPGSGTLSYSLNGAAFVTVPMTEVAPNEYDAEIPAGSCLDRFEFFVTSDLAGGGSESDPFDAPATTRDATVATGTAIVFSDDFEADLGWTVVNENLSDGQWERGVPAGDGTRGDPIADADGSGQCFLTDNVAGNSDVDGGPTRLVSPLFDLDGTEGTVSWSYWMFNDDGDDSLEVEVSNNGGATWFPVTSYTGGAGGWRNDSFTVSSFVTPSASMRIRFSVADQPNDSVTESGIDAVEVTAFLCDSITDCNGNGIDDEIDIQNGTSEDCNNNQIPDECDIADGTSEDCNGNLVPDECDIQNGTSEDCNGNQIPDECDIQNGTSEDCNGNQIPDECDIASGTSEDCNGNQIPDECDIASGTSEDCNGNQIPDECDIQNGTSEDCNGNQIPDECDIASGTSEDCNENDVPDECDIQNGTSEDCNGNQIPDECDIAGGGSSDDNGNGIPDECDGTITFCGIGAVNVGCGAREDILTVNGTTGGPTKTLLVTPSTPLTFDIVEPSAESGDGQRTRVCVYLWFTEPLPSDDVVLPRGLGNMCFGPKLIWTRPAEIILNGIGARNKLGDHTGPGDPPRIPDGGSLQLLSFPDGFGNPGKITVQGLTQDVCTQGTKPFSATNGLLLVIE